MRLLSPAPPPIYFLVHCPGSVFCTDSPAKSLDYFAILSSSKEIDFFDELQFLMKRNCLGVDVFQFLRDDVFIASS